MWNTNWNTNWNGTDWLIFWSIVGSFVCLVIVCVYMLWQNTQLQRRVDDMEMQIELMVAEKDGLKHYILSTLPGRQFIGEKTNNAGRHRGKGV